jgi:RimJ/RimL family protein N-acetyltransferase
VTFVPTARNAAAKAVLDALGFEPAGDRLRKAIAPGTAPRDFITVDGDYEKAPIAVA